MKELIIEDINRCKNKKLNFFGKRFWLYYSIRRETETNSKFLKKICTIIRRIALKGTGCEIPYFELGKGIFIPHLSGIIISGYAKIGDNATIFQQVTIGINDFKNSTGAPKIGNNVYIGAGAKIIGDINIGDNVKIGANAVVTKDVPSNKTVIEFNKII